jgi:hypothetical protein
MDVLVGASIIKGTIEHQQARGGGKPAAAKCSNAAAARSRCSPTERHTSLRWSESALAIRTNPVRSQHVIEDSTHTTHLLWIEKRAATRSWPGSEVLPETQRTREVVLLY